MTFPCVIGLGSCHGDDQAGWLIIDRLQELGYGPHFLKKVSHPIDVLEALTETELILICDACKGTVPGAVHRWKWPDDSLLDLRSGGTHDMPLPYVLQLAEQLSNCPHAVEIWAIEGTEWSPACRPGPLVQAAACDVASAIRRHYHA